MPSPKELLPGDDARKNWRVINELLRKVAVLESEVSFLKTGGAEERRKNGFRQRGADSGATWV